MQYLLLIYGEEQKFSDMAKDSQKMSGYMTLTNDLKAKSQWVGGNRLQPIATATTVRVRNGRMSATDGPFAETKEQLGGYYLIEARDLNDAIQVAGRIPGALYGSVEVRPIWDMGPSM